MTELKRVFMVDGKPFYPLGSQFLDISGYSVRDASETDAAFEGLKRAHGNTALFPVNWDEVEPKEGKFNFTSVDVLLAKARRYGVKLMLLWFGTWKCTWMDYTPAWVKTNPQRFKRVISSTGDALWILSSHCPANFEADKKAFTALCKYLKAKDSAEHTVIGIQVENESGIIGSDRDYGPVGQAVFDSPVPAKLLSSMKAAGKGRVYDIWQQTGGKKSGTWPELFGWSAGELMTAWSFANYIDGLAEAGKAAHDIPMFINVWPKEGERPWSIPGEDYPSGGGDTMMLDIFKWFTPHVDLIAPDLNLRNPSAYESMCAAYARDDNPLFTPESDGSPNMLRGIADYNAIGFFAWIRPVIAEDGSIDPISKEASDIIRCVAAVIPLLLKYQGTGQVHAVIEEEDMTSQRFDFDGYLGRVTFGRIINPFGRRREQIGSTRGWGLVIQASRNEFYLVGANYRLFLRPKLPPEKMLASTLSRAYRSGPKDRYLTVEEGHFAQNGKFQVECRHNGGELDQGVWVDADAGVVVRVIMCD